MSKAGVKGSGSYPKPRKKDYSKFRVNGTEQTLFGGESKYNLKNFVYVHVKKGTDEVFYVGSGARADRAASTTNRPDKWYEITDDFDGFEHRIVNFFDTREAAYAHEKELIDTFGLESEGGQLINTTNITDPKELFKSEKHRDKLSKAITKLNKEQGSELKKAYWAQFTEEERKAEMKRRFKR